MRISNSVFFLMNHDSHPNTVSLFLTIPLREDKGDDYKEIDVHFLRNILI